MKRLKYLSALALSALLGLSSCSNDKLTDSALSVAGGKGYKVSFTLNGGETKTRAAHAFSAGGFDREKTIDATKLYAVVFDQQGKFSKTYDVEGYNASTGECHFTLDEAGVYYGYIVANSSMGTDLKGLTAGTSDENDFYNIIEDTDPGSDNETSTHFLMTSKRTLFDVDGDSKDALDAAADGTDLGNIELTRAVARIDIDASEIDGLEITEVEIKNRVVKSLHVRGSSPATLSSHQETAKTYTRGTNAGEIPALDGATAGQEHGYVDDQQWQGVIYGYENVDANTVVKITHKLNGVASTTTVDFASVNGGQKIKRNNVYTVKLVNEVLTPTLKSIAATINVVDWDESVNLKYTDLTDNEKPDFKVTSTHLASGYTDTSNKLNPNKVFAKTSDAPTEVLLQVSSTGKVASEVAFVDKSGDGTYKFLDNTIGGKIEQVGASTYDNGKIVQNYKITIPQAVVSSMQVSDYLTFKVHNVFDDTAVGSREFKISIGESLDYIKELIEAGEDYSKYIGYAVTSESLVYEDYVTAESAGDEDKIVGMIAYLGPKGSADLSGLGDYYGLIIGNQNDDAITAVWAPETNNNNYTTSKVIGLKRYVASSADGIADKYGILYTNRMCSTAAIGTGASNGWGATASSCAGYKARNCGIGSITGATTSDWFLPANGQFVMAINAAYHKVQNTSSDAVTSSSPWDNNANDALGLQAYNALRTLMTSAFGATSKALTLSGTLGCYWTSSEGYTGSTAYAMGITTSGTNISFFNCNWKTYSDGWSSGTGARVRPFIAF